MTPPDAAGTAFVAGLADAFAAAAARAGPRTERIRIAGVPVALRFAGDAARARIFPAFAPRVDAAASDADAVLDVFDAASTGVAPPPPPFDVGLIRERGEVRGFDDGRIRVAFNVGSGILSVYDRVARRGAWWIRDAARIPYYETASPLRTLLSWILEDRGVLVVHAACVARGGDGVLLTAKGGSGKSTTALLCRGAGFDYLGDNNVAVALDPAPTAHALFGSASLRRDNRVAVPDFAERVTNRARTEEKALAFVAAPGAAAPSSCRLRAVLLPQVTGAARPVLRPATAAEALRALAPSSLFVQPGARQEAFAATARLVRALPAYVLDLADDPAAVVATVAAALEPARAERRP